MIVRLAVGNSYDAVIIGGGVGGLTAAAHLARARARVLVLEASARFGGQAETLELSGGVRAPLLAHTVWALDQQTVKALRLSSYGLEFAQSNMRLFALRAGGKHIAVPEQSFRARAALAAQDARDGSNYVAFHRDTVGFARRMRPLWDQYLRHAFVEEREQTLAAIARWLRLSDRDADRLETLSRLSAAAYLDRWLENDALKAALALDVFPSGLSPEEAGSALVLVWRYAQESGGRQAAVGQLRGGPGAFASALAMAARDAGAELRSRTRVNAIIVERRRAVGVVLESGEIIASRAVLSCLNQKRTLLELVSAVSAGLGVTAAVPGDQLVATAQLIVMLSGLPPFAGLDRKALEARLVLATWPETSTRVKTAALAGRVADELVIEATVPTAADPSLAPGGIHVLSALLPYMPASVQGGWEAQREPLRKQAMAALEAVAPGLRDRVVGSQLLTPDDIDERSGEAGVSGSPWSRLVASYAARIRTPIAGLYFCGRAAEPVGVLSGRAGRIAAEMIVSRLARWTPRAMIGGLNPTPFHARTAAQNVTNAWVTKGGFTVPAYYVDAIPEALAARLTAAVIDITPRQDLRIEGAGAAELLSACGSGVAALQVGHSRAVHWCADGGGLRGSGTVSRMGEHDFLLRSDDADFAWFASAAGRFGASVRDVTCERGLILLAGPYAIPVMVAARLEVPLLELNHHVTLDWLGIPVTVFHTARPLGYEIACGPEDGALLLDRLFRRASLFGLRLGGEDALQVLEIEAGLPAPHADYAPARHPFARAPAPAALGLKDENGPTRQASAVLAGIELDGAEPMAFAPVFSNGGNKIGTTLRSLYSPALRSAIALAELSRAQAAVGTIVKVLRFDSAGPRERLGRIVPLPFL